MRAASVRSSHRQLSSFLHMSISCKVHLQHWRRTSLPSGANTPPLVDIPYVAYGKDERGLSALCLSIKTAFPLSLSRCQVHKQTCVSSLVSIYQRTRYMLHTYMDASPKRRQKGHQRAENTSSGGKHRKPKANASIHPSRGRAAAATNAPPRRLRSQPPTSPSR